MSRKERCQGTTNEGRPCGVQFGIEDGFCWFHHPDKNRDRLKARRKGQRVATKRKQAGQERTVDTTEIPGPLETAADAQRWSAWAIRAKATGDIDDKTCREIQHGLKVFLAAREKAQVDATIAELQAQVAELKGLRVS